MQPLCMLPIMVSSTLAMLQNCCGLQVTMCCTGLTSNSPLERVPDGEIVDLNTLWTHMFNIGHVVSDATNLANCGDRLRFWLRQGKADLFRDERVGSKFTLTLHKTMFNKQGSVISLQGAYTVDLNKAFSKCSCMTQKGKGRKRYQQRVWCVHRVSCQPYFIIFASVLCPELLFADWDSFISST